MNGRWGWVTFYPFTYHNIESTFQHRVTFLQHRYQKGFTQFPRHQVVLPFWTNKSFPFSRHHWQLLLLFWQRKRIYFFLIDFQQILSNIVMILTHPLLPCHTTNVHRETKCCWTKSFLQWSKTNLWLYSCLNISF